MVYAGAYVYGYGVSLLDAAVRRLFDKAVHAAHESRQFLVQTARVGSAALSRIARAQLEGAYAYLYTRRLYAG